MIIIGFVIAVFFILMIGLICRSYSKDIFELENRILQLEKRINECETFKKSWETLIDSANDLKGLVIGDNYFIRKDGEKEMACKGKGKGGKRK
ncbi:MAG: hypothetical protein J6T10_08350 [Methanobrevibacter sp.]|nr:hypothetical protein [Methanobrevibacter sp.]